MASPEGTARHADRLVARLRAERDVAVVRDAFAVDEDRLAEMRGHLDDGGSLDGGAAWVENGGSVLLVRPRAHPDVWTVPGKGRAPDEGLARTAVRAVRETTGVRCTVRAPFLVHRMAFVADEDVLHGVGAYFDATYVDAGIPLRGSEVVETGWFETAPEEVNPLLEDRLAALGESGPDADVEA